MGGGEANATVCTLPPDFLYGGMHGLKMNGQSSCEGEKSELGRGHLEGTGSSQEKTRHVKALCRGPQWMTSGVFNACRGASDLF